MFFSNVCKMRQLKNCLYRWRVLFLACLVTYIFIIYLPINKNQKENPTRGERLKLPVDEEKPVVYGEDTGIIFGGGKKPIKERLEELNNWKNKEKPEKPEEPKEEKEEEDDEDSEGIMFSPVGKESFSVVDVMSNYGIPLKEKFQCDVEKNAPPKILVTLNAGHNNDNLGGCPDWNCQITSDRSKLPQADAVLIAYDDRSFKRTKDQYVIYFSQESPVNAGMHPEKEDFFNMSLGFRHDSPAASPYGYTVKLAKKSWKQGELISRSLVEGKSKGAAWYVSHCDTNSKRERIVEHLKKEMEIDVYGSCGTKVCPRGTDCEKHLNTEYHFYIAFENSICKDYLTEKLWNQGYGRDIIPVVLSRKLIEPFVPPNSFLAVDDYETTQKMAEHMKYLMKNSTAYMEYFAWRRKYKVVFLNGVHHDVLERPWGFCQVCRLMWATVRKQYVIPKFSEYWGASCEADGTLARNFLQKSNAIST